MTRARLPRDGQKTGQAQPGLGFGWGDYVDALIAEHGTLAAIARKLVDRGYGDAASVERAIRRLRARGQRDGGLTGQRLLRVFGVPSSAEARVRWMGVYHSPFHDLPVPMCLDQLRLSDRPPISESKARVWVLMGLAGVALRQRSFEEARRILESVKPDAPAARIEHELATSYLVSRLDRNLARAEAAARPHLVSARAVLDASRDELDPSDVACFDARLADHEAYIANVQSHHDAALAIYRGLPTTDVHPFASYRRDAGLAYGLHRLGACDEALALALRACDHAADGGYVRLRAMGLLMVARIARGPQAATALARAAAIAARLDDAELMARVERLRAKP